MDRTPQQPTLDCLAIVAAPCASKSKEKQRLV